VPWQFLLDLIEPVYPKTSSKSGRPPYPLATMLQIHLMQHQYSLSDPAMEDALIEVATIRRFAVIDLINERLPDQTTIAWCQLRMRVLAPTPCHGRGWAAPGFEVGWMVIDAWSVRQTPGPFATVALAIDLDDRAVVHQPVHRCHCHGTGRKDVLPLAERLI